MTPPTPSPSAPQEVPQWAYEAAKEINARLHTTHYVDLASLIARHAQPALTAAEEQLAAVEKERDEADEESRIACSQREADIKENANLVAKLTAAESELTALRIDRERLDWLEKGGHEVLSCPTVGGADCYWVRGFLNLGDFPTLRAAIDAARQQEGRE